MCIISVKPQSTPGMALGRPFPKQGKGPRGDFAPWLKSYQLKPTRKTIAATREVSSHMQTCK